jgi:hypothetical protein
MKLYLLRMRYLRSYQRSLRNYPRELPNKYTGIVISIHRLGKLYTRELGAIYFRTR